jgi:stress-induced morphogen
MAHLIDTDDKVARFRADVLPQLVAQYRPSKVLVFGSRARGDALKDSDLDVVIVSQAFAGVPWLDRQGRVYDACDVRLDLELLCYTPDEYAGKVEELGIVRTAALEGVDLLDGAPGRGSWRAWWRLLWWRRGE